MVQIMYRVQGFIVYSALKKDVSELQAKHKGPKPNGAKCVILDDPQIEYRWDPEGKQWMEAQLTSVEAPNSNLEYMTPEEVTTMMGEVLGN